MNWLFRRHFFIVHLVFLSIIAIIAAKIVTTLVGYRVSKSIPERPSATMFEEPKEEKTPKDFSIANERNLFAARREQISFADEEEKDTDPGRWQDAQPSSLPLKLISTMVFINPFDSRAVIQDTSSGVTKVFSLNECVAYQKSYNPRLIETVLSEQQWEPDRPCNNVNNMATLVRIEEFKVVIFNNRDKKYETLSLLGEQRRPIFERASFDEGDEESGVKKVGATSYQVKRNAFDKALSNIARLLTEARAVPEKDAKDNFIGFRITYLKQGSLFQEIGIEEKDVLTRINGYDLDSPEKALQLFSKLKTADQFTIDLKRGDRPVTFDYSVVR